jgi:hypothetical protein
MDRFSYKERSMTPLGQRLIEDIRLRNFSKHTVEAYVRAVAHFARHYGCSPEQLDGEQVRAYLLYLVQERKVSWSLYNQTRCGFCRHRGSPVPQQLAEGIPRPVAQMPICPFCAKRCFKNHLQIYDAPYRATQRDSLGKKGVCRAVAWGGVDDPR